MSAPPAVASSGPRLSTEINLPGDASLALDAEAADVGFDSTLLDISPDGRTLVYVGSSNGSVRVFTRQLDSFDVQPLAGARCDGAALKGITIRSSRRAATIESCSV